jgi:hypothetical protein
MKPHPPVLLALLKAPSIFSFISWYSGEHQRKLGFGSFSYEELVSATMLLLL